MKDNNTKYSLEPFTRPEEWILAVRGYLPTAWIGVQYSAFFS
jgi:hypothetical protein